MIIAVAGGTGVVGRLVVEAARAEGHQVSVLSRSTGTDLATGSGLDAALDGVEAVVDASNINTTGRRASVEFFEKTTGNLLRAGQRSGVKHLVALSIVGCDRVGLGYYAGKRRQEEQLLAGPVPASVLRATQFHEFPAQLLERVGGPFALVPRMRCQPVAAREVAESLLRLAGSAPVGMAPELAGPEERDMADLVRRLLRARHSRRVPVPLRIPGAVGRLMGEGGLLPTGPGPRGTETFDQWLARTGGALH